MLLERFYRLHPGRSGLSLICVGQYPGMENFVGLGQLTGGQLASLADTRSPVSVAEFALASVAWNAFKSPVPSDSSLSSRGIPQRYRFLHRPYVVTWSSFLPSKMACRVLKGRRSGCFAIEARYLRCNFSSLFKRWRIPSSWEICLSSQFSKSWHRRVSPLIRIESHAGNLVSGSSVVTLTEVGSRVLDLQEDHVKLNGIERWLGGVHLAGSDAVWRWDSARRSMRLAYGRNVHRDGHGFENWGLWRKSSSVSDSRNALRSPRC